MTKRVTAVLLSTALLLSACTGDAPPQPTPSPSVSVAPTTSPTPEPEVSVAAANLDVPWDVVFTPDGRTFMTQRDRGMVSELRSDGVYELRGIDGVVPAGEGGLLGITASKTFTTDGWLYIYYTAENDNRVARFRADFPDPVQVIVQDIPKGTIHNGGAIAFGPDGMLYIATGDAGREDNAQSRSSLGGKILRVRPDGTIPGDNPVPGSAMWSLGHRNVQGLAWDHKGRMWASEFGPDRDDEINQIIRGGNYGWPAVTGDTRSNGFRPAFAVKQPSEAAWSGLAFVSRNDFPEWGDSLIAAGLRGQRLWRFPLLPDGALGEGVPMFNGLYGRLRSVRVGRDGALWFTTSNRDGRGAPAEDDDRLLRYGR